MDYNDSQESTESFGTSMENIQGKKMVQQGENDGEGVPKRCDRLKDKEDMKVQDLAKERAVPRITLVMLWILPPSILLYFI